MFVSCGSIREDRVDFLASPDAETAVFSHKKIKSRVLTGWMSRPLINNNLAV